MKPGIVAIALVACDTPSTSAPDAAPDAAVAPALRNPVDLPDDQLAPQALQALGQGTQTGCTSCHGLTRQHVLDWRVQSDLAVATCLTDVAVTDETSARAMIDCVRAMPAVATSDFAPQRLGIYAAATHLPWFQFVGARAYGDDAAAQLATLAQQAGMPRGDGAPLTQEQFDVVAEWFARGVPRLDENLGSDPPPTTCTPGISSAVAAHVTTMETDGWRALNRTNNLAMHGCGSATDPRDCLQALPLAADQPYGAGWDLPGLGALRVLKDVTYVSQFWTRASADGRFVAHGVETVTGSYVQDLARDVQVPIIAEWDPAFFPDHSGFSYQGTNANTCAISVLTSNPDEVTMMEPGCTRILTLGQYQHMARALGGGDYFAADSQFVADDGGKVPTLADPPASFTSDATIDITPMIFDGTRYVAKPRVRIPLPFEGDVVLSPSARLALTRVAGPADVQLGFVLRRLDTTPVGASYAITAPEVARYCTTGGKPAFSYDERWVTFHRYDASGKADAYLMELATGTIERITNMAPGQYALFPHFRSDGWIYMQVRDANAGHEYTIASEAALIAE